MRLRFIHNAGTATCVLHDPRAVSPRPPGAPPPNLVRETARGSLVAFSFQGPMDHDEDPARVDVFIDEPVDPEIERLAGTKGQGVLRVPSGQLVLAGADEVGQVTGGGEPIPPGNYDVTWFAVDWDGEVERAGNKAAAAASPDGVILERLLTTTTTVLILLTVIAFGYAGCTTITSDMKFSEAWRVGRWWAAGFGIAWAVLLLFWVMTPARRAAVARAEKQGEFPDFVVALRRTDDRRE